MASTTSSIDTRGRSTIDVFMRYAQDDLQCSVVEAKEPAAPRLAVVNNICGCVSCHLRVIAPRGRFYYGAISILHHYLHEWPASKQPICHPRILPAINERLALGNCWIMSPFLFAVRNPARCHASPQRLKPTHATRLVYTPYPVPRRSSLSLAPGSGAKMPTQPKIFATAACGPLAAAAAPPFPSPWE